MRARGTAAAFGAVLLLSGCGIDTDDLPLPGGAAGDDTYSVSVIFDDAATLVPRSAVRVNDVPVGEIDSISLTKDLRARVVCSVNSSVRLPRNAIGTIASTSLLGENYVSLARPVTTAPSGRLRDGDVVADGTATLPDVEQVLAALSAVLNGGSLGQAQIIVRELTTALRGRSGDVRDLLGRLDTLVGSLDRNRGTVIAALDGLDRLSSTLATQQDKLAAVLADLPTGLKILAAERPKLTRLLDSVGRLGTVATRVIDASRANLATDLDLVRPVLAELKKRGDEIGTALNYALTFPFGKTALAAFKNDYAGFYASLNLNVDDLANLVLPTPGTTGRTSAAAGSTPSVAPATSAPATAPTTAPASTNPLAGLTNLLLGVLAP